MPAHLMQYLFATSVEITEGARDFRKIKGGFSDRETELNPVNLDWCHGGDVTKDVACVRIGGQEIGPIPTQNGWIGIGRGKITLDHRLTETVALGESRILLIAN